MTFRNVKAEAVREPADRDMRHLTRFANEEELMLRSIRNIITLLTLVTTLLITVRQLKEALDAFRRHKCEEAAGADSYT